MGLIAGFLKPSRGRKSILYFSDNVLHLRVRNSSHAPIQNIWCTGTYSSTGDVSGTYGAGILGSRPWIRMYVTRHKKEQELGSGFVVEFRISSAADHPVNGLALISLIGVVYTVF